MVVMGTIIIPLCLVTNYVQEAGLSCRLSLVGPAELSPGYVPGSTSTIEQIGLSSLLSCLGQSGFQSNAFVEKQSPAVNFVN